MKFVLLLVAITSLRSATGIHSGPLNRTSADRIAGYNYPVETHHVQTSDGYVLGVFRIPYSPKLQNQGKYRPVVLLMHGLTSSSDCYILNGPDNALAYLLADAGYDVWLGNARGNIYSKKNVKIPSFLPSFWDFSWTEIALYDMTAMIDYALASANQKSLHYVGHSQGTTVFFVLMSTIPKYNGKIKTAHMLAPVAFTKHLKGILAEIAALLLGNPSLLVDVLGNAEISSYNNLIGTLESTFCKETSSIKEICAEFVFAMGGGGDLQHFNYTLLPDIFETMPAGAAAKQFIHYLQGYNSGHFRFYDHGVVGNNLNYGQNRPPDFKIKNIVAPIHFYSGDSDQLATVEDVQMMAKLLPNLVENYRIPIPEWAHTDFLFSLKVKELVNNKIISIANKFERKT